MSNPSEPNFGIAGPCCDGGMFGPKCGPGEDCPKSDPHCLTKTYRIMGKTTIECECVPARELAYYLSQGWLFKYVLARVDKPGREIQLLIASLLPTTPDQLEELLGPKRFKMPMPPWISKAIGGGGNDDPLPDHPPAFPYTCEDLLYHPGGLGLNVCRMLQPTPKVWNPADPCLKVATKEYWDTMAQLDRAYLEVYMRASFAFNTRMAEIEAARLACRAVCDFSFGICEAACDKQADDTKKRTQDAYDADMEDTRLIEKKAKERLGAKFWAAASACGYDNTSFYPETVGRWGLPMWIPKPEEAQA